MTTPCDTDLIVQISNSNVILIALVIFCPARVLRAYILGYLTSTTPRLLSWLSRLPRKDIDSKQKFKEVWSLTRRDSFTGQNS